MPLIYLPPPPPPPPPKTWPRPPVRPGKRVVWVGPDGTEVPLTDGDAVTSMTGRAGFGRLVPDLVADRGATGAGLLQDYRDTPRLMTVPLHVHGTTPDAYLDVWRRLVATTRHRGPDGPRPGRIRVELPDGSWRDITAYYHAGLEMVEDELDDLIWSRSRHEVEFWAPDPYFQGPPVRMAWQLVADPRPFYPLYPVTVTSSSLGGVATITSPGDADSYPVWEIVGPGTPVVTNATTGQSWAFGEEVPAGEVVTVDCRPTDIAPETGLTAVDSQGTDWWGAFVGYPDLWLVPPGESQLEVGMVGATSESRLRLEFRPRYLAGW